MSTEAEQAMLQDLAIHEGSYRRPYQSQINTDVTSAVKTASPPVLRTTRDITEHFFGAASTLPIGQLVKDEFFTLFEAVGALEIMDPKMDNGYVAPGDTLDDDYDVSRQLEPEETVGIMDAMLCSEVAWHMGHPLSQTLFTSLYLNDLLWPQPTTLHDVNFKGVGRSQVANPMLHVALRAYCLVLIKTCDIVHERILNEGFYEEEDFVTYLYNRSLLTEFPTGDILKVSQDAIDFVSSIGDLPHALRDALVCRLNLRRILLQAVALGLDHAEEEGAAAWDQCLHELSPVVQTHGLGKAVPESFSTKVQRRLASTAPPRPIIDVSFGTAREFLERTFTDTAEGHNVLKCTRMSNVLTFVKVFFTSKPQSSLYTRCLLQALIFNKARTGGKEVERRLIFDELQELVLPSHILLDSGNAYVELPGDDRFEIWQRMSRWAAQIYDAYHDLLRALCMNRARARRMLCHLILDWDNMQLDLEELDTELRRFTHERSLFADIEAWELPLSSWAYLHKLRQMEQIVQMGFELSIYHLDEWPGMYQYLQKLAEARKKHTERIYGFVHHRKSETYELASPPILAAFDHTLTTLEFLVEEATATSHLAQSFSSLYSALGLLGLLPKSPPRPYGTEEFRCALRLRPFLQVSFPRLTSPSEPFEKAMSLVGSEDLLDCLKVFPPSSIPTKEAVEATALLDIADKHGRRSRQSLELMAKANAEIAMCVGCEGNWRKGVKDVARGAIVVGVIASQTKKWVVDGAQKGGLQLKMPQDMAKGVPGGTAACWAVPSIVPS